MSPDAEGPTIKMEPVAGIPSRLHRRFPNYPEKSGMKQKRTNKPTDGCGSPFMPVETPDAFYFMPALIG